MTSIQFEGITSFEGPRAHQLSVEYAKNLAELGVSVFRDCSTNDVFSGTDVQKDLDEKTQWKNVSDLYKNATSSLKEVEDSILKKTVVDKVRHLIKSYLEMMDNRYPQFELDEATYRNDTLESLKKDMDFSDGSLPKFIDEITANAMSQSPKPTREVLDLEALEEKMIEKLEESITAN